MTKFGFNDIKIGDKVLTTNNKIGEVIAIKSYAYINDKIAKKANRNNQNNTFKFDNSRHNGIWYAVLTIAFEDTTAKTPTYYIDKIDFIEIKKIIKDDNKITLIDKIKKFFNNYGSKS